MARKRVRRHDSDAKEQEHLHRTDADRRRHLCPKHHLPQLVTVPRLNVPKLVIGRPDMRILVQLFPVLELLLAMLLPRIASKIQILILICRLIKEHPLVGTLSAVWECCWHPVCRSEQPIERTCMWCRALIERHRILEIIIIYLYVLLKNNVVFKNKVNENTRQAARTMWTQDCANWNDCIMWINPWQNEHQWSVNGFSSTKSGK